MHAMSFQFMHDMGTDFDWNANFITKQQCILQIPLSLIYLMLAFVEW